MNVILIQVLHTMQRSWVKWPLLILIIVGLVVVHVVMYNMYGDTELAPSTIFTILVHSGIATASILIVMYYKKYLKPQILELNETRNKCKD